jgi:hypothetical protein
VAGGVDCGGVRGAAVPPEMGDGGQSVVISNQ